MSIRIDKPHREEPHPEARACEGFACGSRIDIRKCPASLKWLCLQCWAKVDPRALGMPPREFRGP